MPDKEPYVFYKVLSDGRLALYVDASLMKDFDICERYFWYKHIKLARPKGFITAKPFPMAIGSWWSSCMDMFYNHMRDEQDKKKLQGELTRDMIQDIALTCWLKDNIEASAIADPKKFKSFGDVAGAVLMLQEYYDKHYIQDRQTWRIVSVEQGFGLKGEVKIGESNRIIVYWVGLPDLTIVENRRIFPLDHKTTPYITGRTEAEYKPNEQIIGYVHSTEVLAKQVGIDAFVDRCFINVCARNRPADKPRNGAEKKPRFKRYYPNFTRDEINEWKRDLMLRCERLAHCILTNEWSWRKTACANVYRRICDFHDLDSKTPAARDIVLAANFQQGVAWKPYEPEEVEDE
jgi:hypothetical protein